MLELSMAPDHQSDGFGSCEFRMGWGVQVPFVLMLHPRLQLGLAVGISGKYVTVLVS